MSARQPTKSKERTTKRTGARTTRTVPSDKGSDRASTGSAPPEKRRRKESLTREDIPSIVKAVLEALPTPRQSVTPNPSDTQPRPSSRQSVTPNPFDTQPGPSSRVTDINNSSRHDDQQSQLGEYSANLFSMYIVCYMK